MAKDTQVLIVGAGPVGLTAAVFLNYYGVSCRIIDQNEHAITTSNAVGIHARTLELFEEVLLSEKLLQKGKKISFVEAMVSKKKIVFLNFSSLKSKYNFVCDTPQNETEGCLIEQLGKNQITVERKSQLKSFEQDEKGVVAKIESQGELRQISADYLLACDGYHSTVRSLLNIPFEGNEYNFKFMMIDAPITMSQPIETTYLAIAPDLSFMVFPMASSARLIAEIGRSKEFADAPVDELTFGKIAKRYFPYEINIGKPKWSSRFYVHDRLAKEFRRNRVFIGGDAAHVHIPAAAQGMNTGMQDIVNLSWKLALVLKHGGTPKLLDTYESERKPVVEEVLKMTDTLGRVAFNANPISFMLKGLLLKTITKIPFVQEKMMSKVSQIAVNYVKSPIVAGKGILGFKPGERIQNLPVKQMGLKHLILDYSGDLENAVKSFPYKDIAVVYDMKKEGKQGYLVIRPDRYVGYAGADKKEIMDYFKSLMGF